MTCRAVDLSIVIVSYNTKQMLRQCLASVLESTDMAKLACEVTVVDNGSSDSSAGMVEREYPMVRLVRNSVNAGFAAACNQGISASCGRHIMLLNSDCVVLADALRSIVGFLDRNLDVGAVGCRLFNADGSQQPSITSFPHPLKDAASMALKGWALASSPQARAMLGRVGRLLGWKLSRFDDHSRTKDIDFPRGACLTVRREVVAEVGLLDEEFFFTGEEMDWCYRMRHRGWRVCYYADAAVMHYDHGASSQMMGRVLVQTRKSALLFYEKHYGRFSTQAMKALVSGILVLRCFMTSAALLLGFGDSQTLLARREASWCIVRLHYRRAFRALDVFTEMPFKYN